MTTYLIIGNGAAGVTAAETIRQHDSQGAITILTAEPSPMYSRPGLAYVISGEIPLDDFDKFVSEWKARGGDELTQEANEMYQAQFKN